MKKQGFLRKLYLDGKIKAVEPSIEIKDSYLKKSASSLFSAKTLLEAKSLEDSVALTYYSMYHCVTALFYRIGLKCENHFAAIKLLKQIFGIDNKELAKAKEERVDKQYYVEQRRIPCV